MALNSKTNIKLIDAICEGPIEGLVDRRKGVFLNETPLTAKQVVADEDQPPVVHVDERNGNKNQDLFGNDDVLANFQTEIEEVDERVGRIYSETLDADGLVSESDYGKGVVTHQVRDAEADFAELIFTVHRLYCRAIEGLARGQLFSARIKYEVAIDRGDGSFEVIDMDAVDEKEDPLDRKNTIKGIATSPYQFKTKRIDLKDSNGIKSGVYTFRVKKQEFSDPEKAFEIRRSDLVDLPELTPLAGSRADELIWSGIQLLTSLKATYPYTALAYLSIDAEEYGTLPSRSYEVKGKKVSIPSNATPRADGSLNFDDSIPFDGTLQTNKAYTTCPVCCFYDLLTNSRYGAGDFIDQSNLNWIDLIELSKYCNELVETEDGFEPRFAINTVLGTQAEAYSVLQDMASVFRGMLFWKADNVQIAADHGELGGGNVPAIHVFSNSNVVNGAFSYSGSSLKTRSTRVRVRYNDPDNFYKPNFICIEDRALIDKYGVQEKTVVAFGCTSKYQAQRMGKWIMQSEKLHDDTVTFSVGLEGLNVLPGQVFEISDEMRFGARFAGRIVGARVGFVDLDQTATLPSGSNNKLTVVMSDGTVETKAIASVSGTRVTLSEDFTQEPPDNALYAISNDTFVNRKYRCLSVAEGDDGVYSITGVRHVDGIYNVVESTDATLSLEAVNNITGQPAQPINLRITFQQIDDGRNTTSRATVSWERGQTSPVSKFKVRYKIGDGGNYMYVETTNNSIDINTSMQVGKLLIVQVQSVGLAPNYVLSEFTSGSREIPLSGLSDNIKDDGTTYILPPDPEELEIEAIGVDQVVLRWSLTANGQNIDNFVALIKHSSAEKDAPAGTASWPNSSLLRIVEARTSSVVLPLMNGKYFVKFRDEEGQLSFNAASTSLYLPDPIPRYNYEVIREDTATGGFAGQRNNVYYNDGFDGLVLGGTGDFDLIADVDAMTSFDFLGEQVSRGEYIFQKVIDLGGIYSVRMQRRLVSSGLYLNDLIDDRLENIDTWSDFDGDTPDGSNVELYFRSTTQSETPLPIQLEDGSSLLLETDDEILMESTLTFDEWTLLENTAASGRSFQFKAILTSDNQDQTPIVKQLGATLQLERRTENGLTRFSELGETQVTFDKAFYVDGNTNVSVGITALDLEPEDHFVMSEPTADGFTITFKGTFDGNEFVSRRFSYTAVGYGTREAS